MDMKKFWTIATVVISLGALVSVLQAEDNLANERSSSQESCVRQLTPCLEYLNGNRNPPGSCCDPLKSVIKSDPKCLCSMITNKGVKQAEAAGINVTEAQTLPGRCGQHVNPISCLTTTTTPSGGGAPNSKNSVPTSGGSSSFGRPSMVIAIAAAATSSVIAAYHLIII